MESAIAGFWCDDGSGNSLGDSHGTCESPCVQKPEDGEFAKFTQQQCDQAQGTWKPYTCLEIQNFWAANYSPGEVCDSGWNYWNEIAPISGGVACCRGGESSYVEAVGAFQLLLSADETQALAFGDQWDNTDEWNMYSADMRLGSSVEAAAFKFGEDGKHVSYLGDEYLGLTCQCLKWEANNWCILIRSRNRKKSEGGESLEKGKNGNEWVMNDDGTLSPHGYPQLVLGFGAAVNKCSDSSNSVGNKVGIFAKGSPNAVVAKPVAESSPLPPPPPPPPPATSECAAGHVASACQEHADRRFDNDCCAAIGNGFCATGYSYVEGKVGCSGGIHGHLRGTCCIPTTCDETKCTSPDGSGGYDCFAGGPSGEPLTCEAGYEVKTLTFDLYKTYTCCPLQVSGGDTLRWLVDGCPRQKHDLDVQPTLVDASLALGEVECCTSDNDVTRAGCLSGSFDSRSPVTFFEAKALCEGQGWRLCRKSELDTPSGGDACNTGCGYDAARMWADEDLDESGAVPGEGQPGETMTAPGTVTRDNMLYADMDVGVDFELEFELTVRSKKGGWTNVFRITTTNNNMGTYGDRLLAVFLISDGRLNICTDTMTQPNHCHSTPDALPLETPQVVRIKVEGSRKTVHVAGVRVIEVNDLGGRQRHSGARVYFSDKHHNAADASVDSLVFDSGLTVDTPSAVEQEGMCRSTADCRSQPDCVGQMVVCHEGTCYKGNQDAGCEGVANGERYAGQQEGHWCWDGRSDTTCATASAPESPTFQLVLAGNPLSHECSACPDSNQDCKCSFEKASTRDADGNYLCGGYPGCWKVSSYAPAAEEMAASGRSAQQQCESYGDIWCGAGAGQMLGLSFGDKWQWDHQVLEHALLFPANYPKQDCFTSMFLAISIQIIR